MNCMMNRCSRKATRVGGYLTPTGDFEANLHKGKLFLRCGNHASHWSCDSPTIKITDIPMNSIWYKEATGKPNRADLEQEAKSLGIEFDSSISYTGLMLRIAQWYAVKAYKEGKK